ncbi:MAG: hypothetical protein K8L97_32950 [Anaerolineae bacterium]|nr:hypothetical protein [Anaerolineae bacterium]
MKTASFITVFSLLIFVGCSNQQTYPERSLDEISQANFYAYVFADAYEVTHQWTKSVKLWSFNKHCSDFFSEDTWNPLYIIYNNTSGDNLEIRISPQDALWNLNKITTTVDINTAWIPSHSGEYYKNDNGLVQIKIKDFWNMDVIISSRLSLDSLVGLIENLTYFGPPVTNVSNPWANSCS